MTARMSKLNNRMSFGNGLLGMTVQNAWGEDEMSACTCRLRADECTGTSGIYHPLQDGGQCSIRDCERQVTTDNSATLIAALAEIERLQNFESDAKRLALELECLLMSTDLPAATKWWDSAHEALELHRKTIGQYYGEKL